ncbi:MAG TPA: DUF1257 domain-containing protein [Planctomycetaceae bacterium]|nr:DUF1257 domain-containing protein [Planctomycetaceae bacterium]
MSHFTTVKTVIRDLELLQETLRQLHYNFQVGERLPIRGFAGSRQYGQVVINTGSRYDIGFQQQADQTYQVCADWWGVEGNTPIRQHSFLEELNRTYAHQAVRKQVLEEGYIIEEERVLDNGEIEMVVCENF